MHVIKRVCLIFAAALVLHVRPAVAAAEQSRASAGLTAAQLHKADAPTERVINLQQAWKYARAISLAQRVLAIREMALGPEHPNVATALNNLAKLYYDQGRYADAEPLFKRSLAIREKSLGLNHPDVAVVLENLTNLDHVQDRYAEAETFYSRSLAIRESALGADDPRVAETLNHLGNLYYVQERYADAEPLFKRSLAIREKAFLPSGRRCVAEQPGEYLQLPGPLR